MTQGELAEKIDSDQNAVSRIENPRYGKQTLTTLKKVAAAFDVALVVRFVPFSQLIDWVRRVPRIDPGLAHDTLDIPSFQDELEAGVFEERKEEQANEAFDDKTQRKDDLDVAAIPKSQPNTEPEVAVPMIEQKEAQGSNAPIPITQGFQRKQSDRPPSMSPARTGLKSQDSRVRATG